MFIKERKKGITLVALVVTIIVLLMLVGITIGAIFGGDGTLSKAHDSKVASRASTIKDLKDVWCNKMDVSKHAGENVLGLKSFTQNLQDEGVITVEEKETIDNTGELDLGTEIIDFKDMRIPEVGDIVYYDPTKGAASNKLTYISKKGLSKAAGDANNVSGNGYGNQTFQATSADNKWVIIYNKNNQLTLISEDIKKTATGTVYRMLGPTSYLYAEQELHNICSIYGYR